MEDRNEGASAPPPREAPEKVEKAKAFCGELFRRLGAEVTVEVKETPEAIGVSLTPGPANAVELSSALVEAAQYLVNRVVNPRSEGRKWVNLDVGGFREEGDPAVKAMAERLAESAKRMGKVIAIAPISARERRQIHLAMVGVEGVATRSEGEGIFRQLLIVPAKRS
ncbi:Jag family protein [Anaeromyxobacter oryzae]|uniref:RNA-binding protein n=1 Tax=Anaeromyxobacter oryzae TaxID=2918170 RepID=A0ABN6MRA3_9BACT|nr:R3H domain-containing nucleic acid-binding protein [Anaeromyxobacter oryzae]BDG03512.1 RNA-binding protein [Anaeromyxobacter oryzae]